jgi:hypothetical protein
MAAESDAYLDLVDALRERRAASLDLQRLELPAYARVLAEAMIAALAEEPAAHERRGQAFEAFWAGRPPTLDNARVQYGGIMAPFSSPDLRWIYKEASWDLKLATEEPLKAVLAALQLLAAQELEARGTALEQGPEDLVLDTAWRDGPPASGRAAEREALRRNQLLALCVVVGLAVVGLEFLALTWDASLARSRRGIVTHLHGAGALLPPLPAFAVAVASGALAGHAAWRQLSPNWEGVRLKTPHVLAIGIMAPVAIIGWHVFGRLKLLVAIALPLAAGFFSQKLYVPPTSNVAIPPRENMKS